MLSLRSTEPSPTQRKTPPAVSRRKKRVSWWPRAGTGLVGLDIGSSSLKALTLQRSGRKISVRRAVAAATPQGALTNGILTNAIAIAETVREVCGTHRIGGRSAAVAAGGEYVFCQRETLTPTSEAGIPTAIELAASKVLPYPVERAILDYDRRHNGGHLDQGSLLWVSCPSEQVDWLRQAVVLAGRRPRIVDVEACALANAIAFNYEPEARESSAVFHAGRRWVTIALLQGGDLLFSRTRRVTSGAVEPSREDLIAAFEEVWDALPIGLKSQENRRLYLSGGPARDPALGSLLHERFELPVKIVNPFHRIAIEPGSQEEAVIQEQGPAFAVATGLALRGFDL